jgi:hypothetical protein
MGGLFIIHSLIFALEGNIEALIEHIGPYICSSISNKEIDESCCRFSCGLVSDLSNYLEINMSRYAKNFIDGLNNVLRGDFQIETKLTAMIAMGDLCLAIEENFREHLDNSM